MLEKNEKKLKNIYFDAHFHWNFANFLQTIAKIQLKMMIFLFMDVLVLIL